MSIIFGTANLKLSRGVKKCNRKIFGIFHMPLVCRDIGILEKNKILYYNTPSNKKGNSSKVKNLKHNFFMFMTTTIFYKC